MVRAPTPLRGHVEIEREHHLPFATTQIARFEISEPDERLLLKEDVYRLDMCLTPRPSAARARYTDFWRSDDFEPIGGIYLLPPGYGLQVRCAPSVTSSLVCELRAKEVSKWLGEDVAWSDGQRRASLNAGGPGLRPLMRRLFEELRRPGLAHDSMIEMVTAQLALEVGRFCADDRSASAGGGLAPWRLRRIDERLAEDGRAPSLSELAELCNMSVRQLLRAFRASRGCTVGEHIGERRAEVAKRKLQGPDSVKAVARSLGFGSPASFTYAFRRSTGLTPREYREQALGMKRTARSR